MEMPVLTLNDVRLKIEGKEILKGVSLNVNKGEIHAILGPNGAGKSTLASILMGINGLSAPTSGEIVLNGDLINGLSIYERARKGLTLAWQEPARFEGLTVEDFLKISGRNNPELNIEKCLLAVGLSPDVYLSRFVDDSLSGGERKRVELASILALKPNFVILDEIDSGIDFTSIEDFQAVLDDMKKDGMTILMITHNEKLLSSADRASLLCNGKIVKTSDPETIKKRFEECKVCEVLDFEQRESHKEEVR